MTTTLGLQVIDYCASHGFEIQDHNWYDRGTVRIVLEDADVIVHRTGATPARLVEWSARLTDGAPLAAVVALVELAA